MPQNRLVAFIRYGSLYTRLYGGRQIGLAERPKNTTGALVG